MRYKREVLDNGITVIFEKRELPIISVGLGTKFGSSYEKEEEKGIAHFIEHMLFKGTEKRTSKQIAEEIEEKGGEHNAFTSRTFTAAWVKMPSKYLEFSIELLSDMFNNSVFDEKEIEKERETILEEINMYHDNPMRQVFEEILQVMYEKPYGLPALGNEKTLKEMSKEILVKKFKENYFTSNLTLTVVGNCEFNDVKKFAKKYFTKSNKEKNKITFKIKNKNGEKRIVRKELRQAHIAFGMHIPNLQDKNRYAIEIFNSIFSEGSSSRIFQEIRDKRGLAYAVMGMLDQEAIFGELFIYLGTTKENAKKALEILKDELKKMSEISTEEFEKTKEKLISSRYLEREDSRDVVTSLLFEEMAGTLEDYYDYEKFVRNVKIEDLKKLQKEFSIAIISS